MEVTQYWLSSSQDSDRVSSVSAIMGLPVLVLFLLSLKLCVQVMRGGGGVERERGQQLGVPAVTKQST